MKRQGTKVTKKNNETENLKLQLKKYDVINKRVVSRLQPNLTDFREGDFGNIDKEVLSGELALILVDNKNFSKTRLGNLDTYNYNPKIFNEFKSICFKILDGLERGLLLDDKNNILVESVRRSNEILKDITKEALANEVMKRDKRRRKIIEILHIYELIAVVGNDLVNHISQYIQEISNEKNNYFLLCNEMTKKFKEFDGFVDYMNNQFKLISVTYSQIVIQINKDDYTNFKHKFKMSDIETFA